MFLFVTSLNFLVRIDLLYMYIQNCTTDLWFFLYYVTNKYLDRNLMHNSNVVFLDLSHASRIGLNQAKQS